MQVSLGWILDLMKTWQVETSFNQSLLRQTPSPLHYLPVHAMEAAL